MNIVTKMLSAGVGLTMSAGIALTEPAIFLILGENLISPSMSLHLPERSAGQMKQEDPSEKLNFKMKHSVSKLCVDLQRLELTQL